MGKLGIKIMKYDLKAVTFNIPVKIDHPERLENLKLAVDYIFHHFDTNIIVYEVSNGLPAYIDRHPSVKYIFEHLEGKAFHRTRYLNEMALISKTPIIANYDCDVIFQPQNYILATNALLKSGVDGVFPYDGLFVNVPRKHIPQIKETHDVSFVDIKTTENFGAGSVGGALFWNRKSFIKGGMENERFISWGCEDWERIKRFTKVGAKIARIPGPLYHMSHPRGVDSSDQNPHYQQNSKEYELVANMAPEHMRDYIAKMPWISIFN